MLAALDWPASVTKPIADATPQRAADRLSTSAPAEFVALGFSLGGFVALEWLRQIPTRVAGLILIGSNARPDPPANASQRRAQVDQARSDGLPALLETFWDAYLAPAHHGDREIRACIGAMAADTSEADFVAQTELAIARPDSFDTIAGAAIPMLLVRGEDDRLCPADRVAEIGERASDAECATIPGGGHFVLLEKPRVAAAVIGSWLERRFG